MTDAAFCLRCGAPLVLEAGERPHCSRCDFVLYQDPKVAVAAVIATADGILLGKRAIEPGLGKWSFPSGFVDRGEQMEEAVQREVREELGVELALEGLVGVYSERGNPVLLIVYAARIHPDSPPLALNHENSEIASFPPDDFPEMAFSHDRTIVADWRRTRATLERNR
jgi:8-oxo-dGTP diphosphatase